MLNYGHMCYQAERVRTQAEQREVDAQLGQLFAAFARLFRSLAKPVRAFVPPARHRTAGLRACMPHSRASSNSLPGLGHRSST
jgi:hypothetical protein